MTVHRKCQSLIVRLRHHLRVRDNAARHEAYRQAEPVVPVFVFDDDLLHRDDQKATKTP